MHPSLASLLGSSSIPSPSSKNINIVIHRFDLIRFASIRNNTTYLDRHPSTHVFLPSNPRNLHEDYACAYAFIRRRCTYLFPPPLLNFVLLSRNPRTWYFFHTFCLAPVASLSCMYVCICAWRIFLIRGYGMDGVDGWMVFGLVETICFVSIAS